MLPTTPTLVFDYYINFLVYLTIIYTLILGSCYLLIMLYHASLILTFLTFADTIFMIFLPCIPVSFFVNTRPTVFFILSDVYLCIYDF